MKQRRINATLTIAALALTTLLILTALPQAGTAAPTVASLSTNPKRINESTAAHSFIRSPFVDSTPGATTRISAAPRLERQPLESLTALNSTEATERSAPLSVFSVPSVASVVQSPGTAPGDAQNVELVGQIGGWEAWGVHVTGGYAYVAAGSSGLRVVNVSDPTIPIEVGAYDTPGYAENVYVAGGYAYVADKEGGMRVIDVSDPTTPVEVGSAPEQGLWGYRDVYVAGPYAYVATGGSLRVIDVSNPTVPLEVGSTSSAAGESVYVAGNYAYTAGGSGLRIFDVSTPAAPVEVGAYDTPGSGHGIYVAGNYAYVADGYGGLRVVDVSNPATPVEVGAYDTSSDYALDVYVAGGYAYVGDEGIELRIVDVSNPAAPYEVGSYDTTPGKPYGVYVASGYTYVANAWGGLLILRFTGGRPPPPPSFGSDVRVNDDTGPASQSYPAVAVDAAGNAYAVWNDLRNGDVDIYFSKRDAATGLWRPNVRVNDDTGSTHQAFPDIAVDAQGNAYTVWEDTRNGDLDIYFAKLPSGSSTWSTNVRVNDLSSISQHDPAIAVDSMGNAYAVWTDYRDAISAEVYYAKLPAGSDTWSADGIVVASNYTERYPDVAIDGMGNAYAVWEILHGAFEYNVLYAKLPVGSSTWETGGRVDTEGHATTPAVAADEAGNVHIIWVHGWGPGSTDVYHASLAVGSDTWSANTRVNDTSPGTVFASYFKPIGIAVDDLGNAYAVWAEARNQESDIYSAQLPVGGTAWSTNIRVNDDDLGLHPQTYPDIAVDTVGNLYVVWEDAWSLHPETGADIYFARTDGGPPTPFLDLPFEYTNFGEATLANKGGRGPGRVNAWFDHTYPNGRNYNLTLWNGRTYTGAEQTYDDCLSYGTCYDGHNGIDFSYADPQPNEPGNQPLPIRSAAGGAISETVTACTDSCRYGSCSACGAYGNYIIVNHRNHYFTRYAHLREVYVSEGQSVTTADTLGIMGATGHVEGRGDGTHLHLSVYYDDNDDGTWSENEVVDPFHWRGSPPEPWEAQGGPTSYYLWIHQVSTQDPVSGDQGATMTDTTGHIQAIIPPGAFSGQAILELSPVPEAEPSAQLRSSGRSFWLRLLEWLLGGGGLQSATTLQSTTQLTLTKPITLTVTYTDTDVLHLDETQLAVHRWDEEQETWQPLTTTVDSDNHVVTAQTEDLGDFDLQAPLLCATDDLEPDDGYAAARWVWPNDWPLARGLDIPQDSDWSRFDAVQGARYTVRTQNLAGGADTVLNLYDVDALTLLASNDDADGGPASELVWTAPYTGTFFVETVSAPGGTTDCSATYELTIATIPGDVIADCQVDIADIMQVASHWRCKCGDACYHSLYDLDGDCIITVVDIMKVAVHWGETCEGVSDETKTH